LALAREEVLAHYQKEEVAYAIWSFARNRWVGIHCAPANERRMLLRYLPGQGHPLALASPEDVPALLLRFSHLGPRTFYATALEYRSLSRSELLRPENWVSCMPTWDIDAASPEWRHVVEAGLRLLELLRGLGIERSLIVKWSGRGLHVHLHPGALDWNMPGVHPLDVAYAVTEYVLKRLEGEGLKGVRVENKMDPQRLFTCPLSLHRELDRVAVCIEPSELRSFDVRWTLPGSYSHYKQWNSFVPLEAQPLQRRALELIGHYPIRPRRGRRHPPLDEQIRRKQMELGDERAREKS